MQYTNFQVGEKFPLPIQAQGDGGLFQIDINGAMFILQLSRTDVIAVEAFRTGRMELALYEEDGLLFLLYQIDGIFREGWGDAPFALHTLPAAQLPEPAKMTDPSLQLYLIDTRLQLLLAMRKVRLEPDFFALLQKHTQKQLEHPFAPNDYQQKVQNIWRRLTPAQMREKASAVQKVALALPLN